MEEQGNARVNERRQSPDQTLGAPGLAGSHSLTGDLLQARNTARQQPGGTGGQRDRKPLPGVAVFLWPLPEDETEISRQKRWWRTQKYNSCPMEVPRPASKQKGVKTDRISFLTDFCMFQIIFPTLVQFRTESSSPWPPGTQLLGQQTSRSSRQQDKQGGQERSFFNLNPRMNARATAGSSEPTISRSNQVALGCPTAKKPRKESISEGGCYYIKVYPKAPHQEAP